ncbi:nuclear transport factor 2 family protein [Photobacterium sp. OFAV2-7]|uniref:nuclear transport factor 2 family protein n=1 Tax=Photobacterium sp. OFAV2-7 TaxID=2917748 RepID=UPI001EF52513|nr:nuclear transport factor 2 family protein [Photobacterium sp. OFAV2-7]MCG7587633.1 nuclear transport factor 2 family protein [Photobacterium sp. OFAV2-7]
MKKSASYITAALLTTVSLLSACTTTAATSGNQLVNSPMKQTAMKAQDAFFKDFNAEEMKKYFREDYIQHNPHVPTGLAPALGFLPTLKEAGLTYKTHRLLEDGDFIVMHNTYDNAEAFGTKEVVTFDVWRMQDGQVAEHWDAISPVIKETASGRSQFDGPTLVTDTDKTEENKQLIANFMEDVFFGRAPEKISEYISAEQYDQHNPMVKDGLDGLNEALAYLASQNNMFDYHKVHRIFGEGNFVLTQSEGRWNGKPQAFYDLFRIKEGKIVEHWDIIQEIPEKMAHENGMF